MLCETETDGSGNVTGVGPAQLPWPRCVQPCCADKVMIQIRVRYKTGFAKLCASNVDPEGDPDTYFTDKSFERTYHKFASGEEIGTCTHTTTVTCPSAIVSGSTGIADCDCPPEDDTQSPTDCLDHLYDYPVTRVTSDPPVITIGGASATKDDTRSQAISSMAFGEWSEWADLVEIDTAEGSGEAGYLTNFLAGASCGGNGLGAGSFLATATQYESQLKAKGPQPISIAVSEGADIETAPVNRYVLSPDGTQTFSVSAPSFASGWVSDKCVLRCACPVKFAAAA